MPIWVQQIELRESCKAFPSDQKAQGVTFGLIFAETLLHQLAKRLIEIANSQSKMNVIVINARRVPVSAPGIVDEVNLGRTSFKPCAGYVKGWAVDLLQTQNIAIEFQRSFQICRDD